MDKKVIIIALFLLLTLGGGVAFVILGKKDQPVEEKKIKKVVVEQFNTLSVKERPYLEVLPSVSGGEIYLSVDRSSDALLEYELEYQAVNNEGGILLQGGIGKIELAGQVQPTNPKEFCFCSESKGKKKYDTGVTGGDLVLRFSGGEKGDYGLKGDFSIGKKEEKEGIFTSSDVKAKLVLGDKDLEDETVLVVADTFGLPSELEEELLEGPYGFFAAKGVKATLKDSMITIQSKKDLSEAKILLWDKDNSQWLELKDGLELKEGQISVTTQFLGTFVLVN